MNYSSKPTPPRLPKKRRRIAPDERFDETWADTRKRTRPALKGSRMVLNEFYGYMESVQYRGFKAPEKALFIERFKACSNFRQVCQSIPIDIQTVYDHMCLDKKFRLDYIDCLKTENRLPVLNDAVKEQEIKLKQDLFKDLLKKSENYNAK